MVGKCRSAYFLENKNFLSLSFGLLLSKKLLSAVSKTFFFVTKQAMEAPTPKGFQRIKKKHNFHRNV